MNEHLLKVMSSYNYDGNIISIENYGFGHINITYLVVTDKKRYILQRINNDLFKDVDKLMSNILYVTNYIKDNFKNKETINVLYTKDNKSYLKYEDKYYRLYDFIENTICLQKVTRKEELYETAKEYGEFEMMLSNFDANKLYDILPDFHNTKVRYQNLMEAIKNNKAGRLNEVTEEIEFVKKKKDFCNKIVDLIDNGQMPIKVTHNDTKLSNILLDEKTLKGVAVIDLDTVMKGSICYDFGDSIRSGCNASKEDEFNDQKNIFDKELFETFVIGYLESLGSSISLIEKENLVTGAIMMCLECGIRFLTDYLDGDIYFKIKREKHNLDRCRTQFKLVKEIENQKKELEYMVNKYYNYYCNNNNSMRIDKKYKPIIKEIKKYNEAVKDSNDKTKLTLVIERNNGYNFIYSYDIFKDGINDEYNYLIAERIVKSILWTCGGYKIMINGSKEIYKRLLKDYSLNGKRSFDKEMMETIYESDLIVDYIDDIPEKKNASKKVGGNLKGCRIGFDAGGSDRKVSAVIDGKTVYSEEVVWNPKQESDPHYHYEGIKQAMLTAASKMPRVDAIGVSSAGDFVNNKIMVASLFIKCDKKKYKDYIQNMYINIAKEIGAPLEVANDGDVTALAGSMSLNTNNVLGIAMGTSEAAGYINEQGSLNEWISELAFAPVDLNEDAEIDEWSHDKGVGCKYFSQDAVIKLAKLAGFKFDESLTLAEKLKVIQELNENGDKMAEDIFTDIGEYLGHTIAFYNLFYKIDHVLILGRVTSKKGGEQILKRCKEVISSEYEELKNINIQLPDEKSRRVGQSIAAASLPKGE